MFHGHVDSMRRRTRTTWLWSFSWCFMSGSKEQHAIAGNVVTNTEYHFAQLCKCSEDMWKSWDAKFPRLGEDIIP
jgi:hypothetical protein